MKIQDLSTDELRTLHTWLSAPGYKVFEKLLRGKLGMLGDRAIFGTGENDPVIIALANRKLYGNQEILEYILKLRGASKEGLAVKKKKKVED